MTTEFVDETGEPLPDQLLVVMEFSVSTAKILSKNSVQKIL